MAEVNGCKYIVAGCRPWNERVFTEKICMLPGDWRFVKNSEQLPKPLQDFKPKYIFFLHWNWIIADELLEKYDCVCFHMADVPYGRGGSPLQNLIIRGHRNTKLTALLMEGELDAGPVYLKRDLSLEGNAEEIYIRASYLSAEMIEYIVNENPSPIHQSGDAVCFKRRKASESEISENDSLLSVYDFIRMLDADGYPKAFLEHKGFRYEFRRAGFYDDRIEANVIITPISKRGVR